jgi:signal transduction histidine kinase
MKFTNENKTTLFYILAATLLVSVLAAFYFNNQKVKATSNLVEHTQEVLRKSDDFLLDVIMIESGVRGYVLTGNSDFLTPFDKATLTINNNLAALETLTKDNPMQQIRIDSMKKTGYSRKIELDNVIDITKQNGLTEIQKKQFVTEGLLMMDKIKERIAAINAEEFNLLKQRKMENDNSNKNADYLFLLLLFFLVVIAVLIVTIIRNQSIRNKELEDFNAAQKRNEIDLIDAKTFAEAAAAVAKVAKVKAEYSAKLAEQATVRAEDSTKKAEDSTKIAEEATKIAEEAVKSKQQFLSTMSHEIRTPMNAIIGFTKVLLKSELTAKQLEYLTAIQLSGDTLIVLINDILDLAKVDAGKMSFENAPFNLAASLSSMLHLFDIKMQEKNLELIKSFDPKIPEIVMGDAIRLHQIIMNLMGNAVKFTAKGCIKVSTVLLNEDAESVTVQFAIADTGIGISEDKMESIFDNFQQASSETARLFGGTGLGLAIVKQLVEAQGGTVSVISTINDGTSRENRGGSVFSFDLRFLKTEIKAALNPELIEFNTEIKNIKVLVVEDMKLNQLLMQTILDDFGFTYDMADNGLIAVEKLKNNTYDIILMDLQMPEMNGFEATDYIRNSLKSTVPIIALTADVTTVDVAKCTAVGMNDYISKPLDERILYTKIRNLIKTF